MCSASGQKILQGIHSINCGIVEMNMYQFRNVTKNPLHYESMGVKKITLDLNGSLYPIDQLSPDEGLSTSGYHALIKACSISNSAFCFDGVDYDGCYNIFAWDTTASGSSAACSQITNPNTSASWSISCEFGGKAGLTENIQVLVIAELEKTLMVDSENNWSLSG